jgi:pre-mRNA-splicing helicase BRR2
VEPFWLIVEDADGEVVLFHQYWLLRRSLAEEEHSLSFTVPVSEPLPPQYFVRMMSDRWIGCEATLAVSFRCVGDAGGRGSGKCVLVATGFI